MARQLAFDWPTRPDFGAGAYVVSDSNRAAHALVTDPGRWPEGKLVLTGPPGSGKTHLAQLFAAAQPTEMRRAAEIRADDPLPAAEALVIEAADRLRPGAEEWLFHAHNHLTARAGRLLLTAETAPSRWPLTLPDLASRLQAAPVARLEDPDDALLEAVLHKLFEDRQIVPDPRLVPYLVTRMNRSLAEAGRLVDRLDRASLGQGRKITPRLAAEVLDEAGPEH